MFIPTYRIKFIPTEKVGVANYEVVPRHILMNVNKITFIDTIYVEANNQKFNEILLETNIDELSYVKNYQREEERIYISSEDLERIKLYQKQQES